MELYYLDADLNKLGVVTEYESLIWTSKLYDHSEAKLKCAVNNDLANAAYLMRSDAHEAMRVTRVKASLNDREKSLEIEALGATSHYDARTHFRTYNWYGRAASTVCCELIIYATNPAETGIDRSIKHMTSPVDITTSSLSIAKQVSWGKASENIFEICEASTIASSALGFRVDYGSNTLIPTIFGGRNLTTDIVLSDRYGDILSASWDTNRRDWRNYAVIAGEGEEWERVVTTYDARGGDELLELFVDARDLRKDQGSDKPALTDAQYNDVLRQRGREKLADAPYTESFEAQVTQTRYLYGRDYVLGDRIAYEALGNQGTDIITEITEAFEGGDVPEVSISLGTVAPTIRRVIRR